MISRRSFAHFLSMTAAATAVGGGQLTAASQSRTSSGGTKKIKPRRLSEGDTVGLVLPASAVFEREQIAIAKEQLETIGFKVKLGQHVYDRHGYLAGKDADRAADINGFFADDGVAGIVCYTGGWGSPRILPLLDYALIARKPKVFIGYSDITALLVGITQKTGLVTFHGPVGGSVFDPYTLENFKRVLMTAEPAGVLQSPPRAPNDLVERANRILRIAPGRASGPLVGGNLTMIASTMGTPWEIETDGRILFLEDVREELYRVDRMLTQLALGDKLKRLAGVVFGRCTNCDFKGPTFSLEELLSERFGALGVPAISGLSFGHIDQKLVLPLGIAATVDGGAGTLSLDETAVL